MAVITFLARQDQNNDNYVQEVEVKPEETERECQYLGIDLDDGFEETRFRPKRLDEIEPNDAELDSLELEDTG